jgi:hypothetical protein
LLEAIERTVETIDMTIKNRVIRRWVHIDLIKLTVKKSILYVKLKDNPSMNKGHSNKSMSSGPMSNRSKDLLIITTILLLKTTSNKTRFIALNRAIKANLDLIDPLACDQISKKRMRNKIPSVGTLKNNNLNHSKLSLKMSNISIGRTLIKRLNRA